MGSKTILFDLDDTLLDTHIVFTTAINEVKGYIVEESGEELEKVSDIFDKSLVRAYSEVSINPVKEWPTTLKYLQEQIPIPEDTVRKSIERMYSVYGTVPELFDGAKNVLQGLTDSGYTLGLVTHAVEDWTNLKLDKHNLRKYFKHIEICNIDRHKNSSDWHSAFTKLGVHPSKGVIVGDNIKGDIIAGSEIGTETLIWINKGNGWSVYSVGEIPKGTHEVKHVVEVPQVLDK